MGQSAGRQQPRQMIVRLGIHQRPAGHRADHLARQRLGTQTFPLDRTPVVPVVILARSPSIRGRTMVPATMGRKAMVAALCAVVVCPFAVLMSTQVARADEPVPLGQVPQTDVQTDEGAADDQPLGDWSGDDWSGHEWSDDWSADISPGDGTFMDSPTWDDWYDTAATSDLTWEDWFGDDGSDSASPADEPSPDVSATEAPTADTSESGDTASAATLLATATTLATDVLAAPTMSVSGTTISWTSISGVSSYVFVRKVPGQAAQYSVVNGTSVTPPVVAGQTVSYGVRTNVSGSNWANEVTITYPAATVDPKTAPRMSVSGNTVSWTAIPSVSSYVFVRKVPGQTTQYSIVNGTSVTPPVVAGKTVGYGVRTNVSGSYWANEISITYPATSTSSPTSPTPTAIDGTFQMGITAGSSLSYELSFLRGLGAHTARLDYGIGTSASSMASVIDAYAKAGIRPLLLATFYGRNPTTAEAQNLGTWAAMYGPGGSFWAGKTYPANTAVTSIELGNETSYTYQFSDNSSSTYAARAQTYALRAKDAAAAIAASNSRVGLLVQGDNAQQQTAWVQNMFRAVPDLGQRAAGWTIHPYGPNWAARIDSTVNSTATAGSPARPIWVTEWGLSSDNGRCLSDNYGWNKCMTYGEAASTLHSVLSGMPTRYGSRLGAFFLYQAHDQYATGTKTGREAYFGALQSNGSAKGAYTTELKADLAVN